MTHMHGQGRRPDRPGVFGPVKPHLTDHKEDHERGWAEPADAPDGGKVPRVRQVSRVSLAERFAERVREAENAGPEGR
jgi:hypothetical protein